MSDKAKRLNLPLRADRITILDARSVPLAAVSAIGYSSEEDEEIAAAIVDAVNASARTAPREKGRMVKGEVLRSDYGTSGIEILLILDEGESWKPSEGQLVEVRLCEGEGGES